MHPPCALTMPCAIANPRMVSIGTVQSLSLILAQGCQFGKYLLTSFVLHAIISVEQHIGIETGVQCMLSLPELD
jgi:hypothetical protein